MKRYKRLSLPLSVLKHLLTTAIKVPTLLPGLGGTSYTSGNDTDHPEIAPSTLPAKGSNEPHASHQASTSPCKSADRGSCHHHHHPHARDDVREDHAPEPHYRDVENDAALERVVVLMFKTDCSMCTRNLGRTLRDVPGVYHPYINFVQGRIEFQLDASLNTPEGVVRIIRQLDPSALLASDQYHHIDVVIPTSLVRSVEEQNLHGLVDISVLDEGSARVCYDPTVSGARDLLDRLKEFSQGVELAPVENNPAIAHGKRCRKEQLIKLCVAAVMTVPVAVLNMVNNPIEERSKAVVSLVLASLVQLIAVPDFYKPAILLLMRYHTFEMDMLVTISITAAYAYSVTAFGHLMAGKALEEQAFFETSALLTTFVLLGRVVATYARTYAVGKVSFRSLQTTKAIIAEHGQDREIDSRLLQFGDKFKVLPEMKIPTDGQVVEGSGEVNESMLTGEGLPVRKMRGSNVSAGTINGTGTLIVQLSRLPGRNTVTDIAGQVEEASKTKPRVQEIADRLAKHVVTVAVVLVIVVFVTWLLVELKLKHAGTSRAFAKAITYSVAVLAVSCPCALGLAVPMVIVVAGGLAAKEGVIIKASKSTVYARKVTDVVFDKTGTITQPTLEVEADHTFSHTKEAMYPLAKALVQDNRHPVSLAVKRFLEEKKVEAAEVTDKHVHPGQGVAARAREGMLKAGSPQWTLSDSEADIKRYIDDGYTVFSVTCNDTPIVCFALRVRLQPDAVEVVKDLTRRGITVHLVSGDHDVAVWNAAREAGIPDSNVASRCSLKEKVDYVANLQSEKKKVLFCGDGANDAGAVTHADVGVHVGGSLSSSDITCDAADVVLLNGIKGIPYLLNVSRSALRRIQFNFAWALTYNLVAVVLAGGALVKAGGEKARIEAQWAGLGELVSVLPVIIAGSTMLFSRSVRRRLRDRSQ